MTAAFLFVLRMQLRKRKLLKIFSFQRNSPARGLRTGVILTSVAPLCQLISFNPSAFGYYIIAFSIFEIIILTKGYFKKYGLPLSLKKGSHYCQYRTIRRITGARNPLNGCLATGFLFQVRLDNNVHLSFSQ